MSLAGEEAVKAKRCLQSLRFLWRNTRVGSHSPSVQEMKDCLIASPRQEPAEASQAEPECQGSESEDVDSPGPDDASDEASGGRIDDAPQADDDDADSLHAPTMVMGGYPSQEDPPSPSQDAHENDELEWDELPDSQVGNNWLSGFYRKNGCMGKTENSHRWVPKCVEMGEKKGMLQHIYDTLANIDRRIGSYLW